MQGMVGMGLYQTLTRAALWCDVRWLVAIFDFPVFRLIRWKLGPDLRRLRGPDGWAVYGFIGQHSAWCDLLEAERLLAAADPYLHEVLFLGKGLEAALRPLDLRALRLLDRAASSGRCLVSGSGTACSPWARNDSTTSGTLLAPTGRE